MHSKYLAGTWSAYPIICEAPVPLRSHSPFTYKRSKLRVEYRHPCVIRKPNRLSGLTWAGDKRRCEPRACTSRAGVLFEFHDPIPVRHERKPGGGARACEGRAKDGAAHSEWAPALHCPSPTGGLTRGPPLPLWGGWSPGHGRAGGVLLLLGPAGAVRAARSGPVPGQLAVGDVACRPPLWLAAGAGTVGLAKEVPVAGRQQGANVPVQEAKLYLPVGPSGEPKHDSRETQADESRSLLLHVWSGLCSSLLSVHLSRLLPVLLGACPVVAEPKLFGAASECDLCLV
eukprot:scaffold1233_cov395-Prasinococcus_capsulatus_cf.AAC.15